MSNSHMIAPFEMKSLGQDGSFSGYASVFHITDLQKDQMMPGAFSYTLKEWQQKGKWPFLLWQHQMDEPIGMWRRIKEDEHGLHVEGNILLNLQKGKEAYILMKSKILEGLSVGFIPIVSRQDPREKVRKIYQVKLIEISLVTLPANPEAQLQEVKTII